MFDEAWCTGLRCPRKKRCARWTFNLEMKAEREKINLNGRRIVIVQYADQEGGCRMYKPVESCATLEATKRELPLQPKETP